MPNEKYGMIICSIDTGINKCDKQIKYIILISYITLYMTISNNRWNTYFSLDLVDYVKTSKPLIE